MNKNLFNILSTFSESEWEELGRFISSPYFVKKRNYDSIYSVLKKIYSSGKQEMQLTKKFLLKKLYKGKSPGLQTLHNRLSEFCKLTERFLSQKKFDNDKLQRIIYLLDEFYARRLPRNFKSKFNSQEKIIYEDSYNAENFFQICQVILLESGYLQSVREMNSAYREFNKHSQYMLAYFLDRLFYLAVDFYSLESSNVELDFNIVNRLMRSLNAGQFISELEKQNFPIYTSVLIRYYLYKAVVDPDEKSYIKKVRKIFSANKDNLNESFKTSFFLQLESYYVTLLNQGKYEYERELFLVYKEKLEQGIYKDLLKIYYPSQNFRDYVIVGLRVNEIQWVENFVNEYAPKLPESIRKDEYTMGQARILIYKSEFRKALKLLQDHRSSNQVHIIDISRSKMKIFFELGMYEEIFLEMDNLKHFLKKSKAQELLIDNTKDFLEKLSQLVKIATSPLKESAEALDDFIRRECVSTKGLSEKNWFLDKAKKLKII
ncbi:MAG: hypothetical protein ABI462_12325 [Ignavibacteria bacterium]